MLRKFSVAAAAVAVAATTAIAPAMADEVVGVDRPAFDQQQVVKPVKPGKKTYEEQVQQAELTSKRLDNAKKGIDSAKTIVDTLNGFGGLFGFGKK
ncbi:MULTISPECIES: hypothetical protein [Corynebacterium]|uniref:Uncharacterized protein n=1 Tax=Corynebacterium lowii TaxID=1544413 RepID=A0A0Q1E0C5_9CORY|nr:MULTISPECIES: hypothetical protein [Corynebacterium]KQB85931.1 hypothetical protein Clow_01673 [Corynebacterium lowii]MDK8451153.1 hypothetical protein [Corynebacterium mastitidis]MDP9850641.1 hypothetical protein [Corynebacterium lowii]